MTFYGQPPSAAHYVKFVLFVCLFVFSFYFRFFFFFFAEILFFAYFFLVFGCLMLTPKVAPWHWLGSTVPIFSLAFCFSRFACPAVTHVSYPFIFIHDSCVLLMCQ